MKYVMHNFIQSTVYNSNKVLSLFFPFFPLACMLACLSIQFPFRKNFKMPRPAFSKRSQKQIMKTFCRHKYKD